MSRERLVTCGTPGKYESGVAAPTDADRRPARDTESRASSSHGVDQANLSLAIDRILTLHQRSEDESSFFYCQECGHLWPCATAQACEATS